MEAALRLLRQPEGPLDQGHFDHLHRAGLLGWDEDRGYRVPYRLYEDLLRRLCPAE